MEKYKQIAATITKRIVTGHFLPGDRIPSEKELADTFGVSAQTVNKAISILVSDGILTRKPGYGAYVCHRVDRARLRERCDFRVGILFDSSVDTIADADRVLARIAFNLQHELSEAGFQWTVIGRGDGMDFHDFLPELDGMIVVGGASEEELRDLRAADIPCVAFNRNYLDHGIGGVVISDEAVGEIVSHMAGMGFDRFLYVVNDSHKEVYDIREDQYRSAVEDAHGSVSVLIVPQEDLKARKLPAEAVEAARSADVAFSPNDSLALSLVQSLEAAGLVVPDDLAVFGFDNSMAGRHNAVPLSTVAYDVNEACQMMVELIEGILFRGETPRVASVGAWLILRESSDRRKGAYQR